MPRSGERSGWKAGNWLSIETERIATAAWPLARLGELIVALAGELSISIRREHRRAGPAKDHIQQWLAAAAQTFGLELPPVRARYDELDAILATSAPLLIELPAREPIFIAVLASTRARCTVLTPELRRVTLPLNVLRAAIVKEMEDAVRASVANVASAVGGDAATRERLECALLQQKLARQGVHGLHRVQAAMAGPFAMAVRRAGIVGAFGRFVAAYALQYGLWLLAWWIAAQWALQGIVDWGWVVAWVLLLITVIPLQTYCSWLQGAISVAVGALIKQRLLIAALRFDVDDLRKFGPSALLARVLEAQVVEQATVNGVLLAVLGTVELTYAGGLLAMGVSGSWHAVVLLAWCALFVSLAWRYFLRRRRWTDVRLSMTHDLIESMIGHRTRKMQQRADQMHDDEDDVLRQYLDRSKHLDDLGVAMTPMPWHAWLALSVLTVMLGAAAAPRLNAVELAISIGGTVLAGRGLQKWVQAFGFVTDAGIAWSQVRHFFGVDPRTERHGIPELAAATLASVAAVDIEARNLVFSYPTRSEPTVRNWSVKVSHGDRVLLLGTSGGGKSTLASLLAGARVPASGVLLMQGLDHGSLGTLAWRRSVAAVPQFHENHILANTMLFNLLMGRAWPPTSEDVREALAVCRELGLDELLARMPAGILQFVGESGWQLSHGERSRVYVARALLQRARLVILDESFGALDPHTFQLALGCVLRRAEALVLIAHP